ncbi:metallophosphoesterase family protein [Paenibacillus whitsoniae]|uniref:metallophosphoesterase family protein n=1 Tax=Paenibacillus whitsoniae TaxID=2496558 RepID=UPI0013DFEB77|nr:metallophosphoesterase [Paenibacillus whitsoniae]
MRIIVIGDFHLDPNHYELSRKAMEDVNNTVPDLVIPLGDFGSRAFIGSMDGLLEVKPFLDMLNAAKRPILGNHDLQRESGTGSQPKGTMESALQQMFHLDKPYGVMEFDEFRLFFASTEPQPADSCYSVQECFATDEQFAELITELDRRPGVPVIFFTHAPPIGCGLRTVPRVHVKSTNAYLDQNHDPYRWKQLYEQYPEIVMWFSAHYHLGHSYIDSHTFRNGTHFFLTGVHGTCTRDGSRLSRMIDISSHSVKVLTLDHVQRSITNEGAFNYNNSLSCMIHSTKWQPLPKLSMPIPDSQTILERIAFNSVGEQPALPQGLHLVEPGKYFVSTQDGFTWEVETDTEAVKGCLHIGEPLQALAVSGDYLWMAWDNYVGLSHLSSPWRFTRSFDAEWPQQRWVMEKPVQCMAPHPDGGVWIACNYTIQHFFPWQKDDSISKRLTLQARPHQLMAAGAYLWILCEDGTLWKWDGLSEKAHFELEDVLYFDIWGAAQAAVIRSNHRIRFLLWSADGFEAVYWFPFQDKSILEIPDLFSHQLLVLGDQKLAALVQGNVYYWDKPGSTPVRLPHIQGQVSALTRSSLIPAADGLSCGFAVHVRDTSPEGRQQLELWAARTCDR